jgi:hypothetical protein
MVASTERLLRAIADPHTTILGHMTGSQLQRRPGYERDYPDKGTAIPNLDRDPIGKRLAVAQSLAIVGKFTDGGRCLLSKLNLKNRYAGMVSRSRKDWPRS